MQYEESKIVIIEIASLKEYIYDDLYLSHATYDDMKYKVSQERKGLIKTREQEKVELFEDIRNLRDELVDKKLIIVCHICSRNHGKRFLLTQWLQEICHQLNIEFINPNILLQKYSADMLFVNESIMLHYTDFGHKKIYEEVYKKILDKIKKMKLYVDNSWITEELDDLSYLHLFDHKKFDFVNSINDANVLLQTDFNNIRDFNGKKVLICMEPRIPRDYQKYDLVISTHKNYSDIANILYIPFMFFYLYTHKYTDYILNRKIYFNPENKKKFCIFINSNNNAWQRIDFCRRLMEYKKVDCYAGILKNCEGFTPRYWTHEFLNLVRQYKFMICFENSDVDGYITEKSANAYLGDTVPIYWGNSNACKMLNKDSLVYLEEYNQECINKAIQEIVYLDTNEEAYKNKITEPLFLNNQIPKEFDLNSLKNVVYEKLKGSK